MSTPDKDLNALFSSGGFIPEILSAMSYQELHATSVRSFSHPEWIQGQVLQQIVSYAKHAAFGRKHHFDEIKGVDDFQRLVPIGEWADVEPYVDRMADGEEDILIRGKPKVFIATTGTTGAKSKLIPETELGALARNLVMKLRIIAVNRISPGILDRGCIFPLSNILPGQKTSAGIPISYASGLTLNQSLGGHQTINMAFPVEILALQNPQVRDYLLMRFAMGRPNILLIAGNNAGRLTELIRFADAHSESIIQDIANGTVEGAGPIDPALLKKLQLALVADPGRGAELRQIKESMGKLLPRSYWPSMELMLFWLSSSVGHYINDVKPLMPDATKYMDMGYGASEGKFNIPWETDNPAGALSILTAFYEFLPEGGGAPLLAHQLEDQKCYEMLITTWAGLYRYNLKDVVKVEGFTGKTPNIVFQYKSGDILNIAEEKIPAVVVSDALRKIAEAMGVKTVQIQIFPSETERQYFCYLEPEGGSADFDAKALALLLHEYLSENILIYNLLVAQQKLIKIPEVVQMKAGWQLHLYALKTRAGQSSTQVKLPAMIHEKAESNWIR